MKEESSHLSRHRVGERDYERIDEGPELVVVDMEDCDAREVGGIYIALAVRLMQADLRRILVKSGKRSAEGHPALRDAIVTVLRHAGLPKDLRIALLPQSPRAAWVFSMLLRELLDAGFALQVFDTEEEARAWLQE